MYISSTLAAVSNKSIASLQPINDDSSLWALYGDIIGATLAVCCLVGGAVLTGLGYLHRRRWDRENRQMVPHDIKTCRLKNLRGFDPRKDYKGILSPVKTVGGKPITMDDSSYHPIYTLDQPVPKPGKAVTQICGVETKP